MGPDGMLRGCQTVAVLLALILLAGCIDGGRLEGRLRELESRVEALGTEVKELKAEGVEVMDMAQLLRRALPEG